MFNSRCQTSEMEMFLQGSILIHIRICVKLIVCPLLLLQKNPSLVSLMIQNTVQNHCYISDPQFVDNRSCIATLSAD